MKGETSNKKGGTAAAKNAKSGQFSSAHPKTQAEGVSAAQRENIKSFVKDFYKKNGKAMSQLAHE